MSNLKSYHKQYYKDNKERIEKYRRQWERNNPEKRSKYNKDHKRKWRKNNPRKALEERIKKYNLSYEDWVRQWTGQDGECAICGQPFDQHSDAYVDHNHKTGEVRGLLCNRCNLGIGFLNDDPKITVRATKYLLEG